MNEGKSLNVKFFLFLVLISFVFSIGIRYIWISQFSGIEQFSWNSELMINTNDGYFYAEGARDIIGGGSQENDLSPTYSPLSQTTAFLIEVLPFSIETIILWMPAIFGSLLVLPVLLISRALNQEYMGFISALLAGIAWSYYNRTMAGYYDTDMLVIVLPTFVLWSIIYNLKKNNEKYLILIPLFISIYSWWYPGSYSLNIAMAVMLALYIVAFDKKNIFNYKILIFTLLSVSTMSFFLKLAFILALYLLVIIKKEIFTKNVIAILLGIVLFIIFVTGGFAPIWNQISVYVFREAVAADIFETMNLNYYAVSQTVREAGRIPFDVFANRISGHTLILLFSMVGYLLLSIKYRVMLLALPMLGLGFLALKGGLRFTVYAVPIMALGMGYLIIVSSKIFELFLKKKRVLIFSKSLFVLISVIAVLYPNINHVINYKVPTVFTKKEVKVLDDFSKIAQREDYVVSWWDYGYPIRYYSDVKTLIDGGKHSGKVNFPVSFSFLNNQISAANMARLEVEYTEKAFKEKYDSNMIQMMKDYKEIDVNDFLTSLEFRDLELPEKTRDIYFYLPDRMLNILPTVSLFSNIDLRTGKQKKKPFFYQSKSFQNSDTIIDLGNNIKILKNKGEIQIGQKILKINRFTITQYDNKGSLRRQVQSIDKNSPINVIFMKNYNKFLIMDNNIYSSTFVQLYVLENYDKELFEPIILTPLAKVYKLKI